MDTRKLVDPALLHVLDAFPTFALSNELLAPMREAERFAQLPVAVPAEIREAIEHTVRNAPGPAGAPDITLTIYKPRGAEAALPCIYHIHGGGYVGGAAAQLEPLHRLAAFDLNCTIVSVDYRLAPEHRFPASIEDCYSPDWHGHSQTPTRSVSTARASALWARARAAGLRRRLLCSRAIAATTNSPSNI